MRSDYAGLWPRLKAFGFDYLIIAAYLILLAASSMLLSIAVPSFFSMIFKKEYSSELFGFMTVTLPVLLYFALSEASPRQATRGKRRFRLTVNRKKDRTPLSPERSLYRSALKFIPWELAHACIWYIRFHPESTWLFTIGMAIVYLLAGLNIILLLFTKTHQTLYDIIAGTIVEEL